MVSANGNTSFRCRRFSTLWQELEARCVFLFCSIFHLIYSKTTFMCRPFSVSLLPSTPETHRCLCFWLHIPSCPAFPPFCFSHSVSIPTFFIGSNIFFFFKVIKTIHFLYPQFYFLWPDYSGVMLKCRLEWDCINSGELTSYNKVTGVNPLNIRGPSKSVPSLREHNVMCQTASVGTFQLSCYKIYEENQVAWPSNFYVWKKRRMGKKRKNNSSKC